MENKNFALSDFAFIEGSIDYVTSNTSVKLIKSQFGGKGQAYAPLSNEEWNELIKSWIITSHMQ